MHARVPGVGEDRPPRAHGGRRERDHLPFQRRGYDGHHRAPLRRSEFRGADVRALRDPRRAEHHRRHHEDQALAAQEHAHLDARPLASGLALPSCLRTTTTATTAAAAAAAILTLSSTPTTLFTPYPLSHPSVRSGRPTTCQRRCSASRSALTTTTASGTTFCCSRATTRCHMETWSSCSGSSRQAQREPLFSRHTPLHTRLDAEQAPMVLAEVAAVADEYWIPYYNVECRVIKGDNKPLSQVSHNPLGSLPFSPSHHSLPFPFRRLIPIPIPSLP